MAAVDRQAIYWQTELMPLLKKSAGKDMDKDLVKFEPSWRPMDRGEPFKRLDNINIKNITQQSLNHVVVEILAENQWKEKVAQYYFFPSIGAGETYLLCFAHRWEKRRLDFTNSVNLTCSVWTDSGNNVDRKSHILNPQANPDPEGWRKDFLRFDNQSAERGELWGNFAIATFPSPERPPGK